MKKKEKLTHGEERGNLNFSTDDYTRSPISTEAVIGERQTGQGSCLAMMILQQLEHVVK